MAQIPRVGSLEINQDLDFERRQWAVQRAAWALVLLILAAALLGAFGSGPLSNTSISSGPLTLEYERLTRERAPTTLQIHLDPQAVADGEAVVWINQPYLRVAQIQRMMPEPVEMVAAADHVRFHFLVANADAPAEITFEMEPAEPGRMEGRLGIDGGPDLAFTQFVFP